MDRLKQAHEEQMVKTVTNANRIVEQLSLSQQQAIGTDVSALKTYSEYEQEEVMKHHQPLPVLLFLLPVTTTCSPIACRP